MGSTFPSMVHTASPEDTAGTVLRWRSWPLVDSARWSWLAVVGVVAVAGLVTYAGGSWILAVAAVAGLTVTLWQFFVPVQFEAGPLGLRRNALGRTRLVPWHAVRAYQLRASGVVLFQHAEPIPIDLLRSIFVPYPADEDELLCALRQYLAHAVELPQ